MLTLRNKHSFANQSWEKNASTYMYVSDIWNIFWNKVQNI